MGNYCDKYYHLNPGMIDVFYRLYAHIINKGVLSNIVATCGEDIDRYIKLVQPIIDTPNAKAIFVERDRSRFDRINNRFNSLKIRRVLKRKIKIIHGNVVTYEDIPYYPLKRTARVEDIGLGIRFDKMIHKAISRLSSQMGLQVNNGITGKPYLKAQIIDGSRKRSSDINCFRLLQQYFGMLGANLVGINGCLPSSRIDDAENNNKFMFNCGRRISTYEDDLSGHRCRVYQHSLEFFKMGRLVDVGLYSYINGGNMLACVIIYR